MRDELLELAALLETAAIEIASEYETPNDYPATAAKLHEWAERLVRLAKAL